MFQPRDAMKDTFKTMLCAVCILWIVSSLQLACFAQTTAEIRDKSQPSDFGMLMCEFISVLVFVLFVDLVVTALQLELFLYIFCFLIRLLS